MTFHIAILHFIHVFNSRSIYTCIDMNIQLNRPSQKISKLKCNDTLTKPLLKISANSYLAPRKNIETKLKRTHTFVNANYLNNRGLFICVLKAIQVCFGFALPRFMIDPNNLPLSPKVHPKAIVHDLTSTL